MNEHWQIINEAPEGDGWFVKMKIADRANSTG